MSQTGVEKSALAVGGLAAILASACCLGPLLLVGVGLGGAWIGNLTLLAPFRPIFIGAALVAMFFAYRRIFRPAAAPGVPRGFPSVTSAGDHSSSSITPAAECKPGDVCALPETRRAYRVLFWMVSALVLVALAFPYVLPLFY